MGKIEIQEHILKDLIVYTCELEKALHETDDYRLRQVRYCMDIECSGSYFVVRMFLSMHAKDKFNEF